MEITVCITKAIGGGHKAHHLVESRFTPSTRAHTIDGPGVVAQDALDYSRTSREGQAIGFHPTAVTRDALGSSFVRE